MWAISQGNLATEIVHFERMGIDGLSLNSLIFTTEQAIAGREGNGLLVHVHQHTLAYSLFFLSDFVTYFLSYLSLLFLLVFLLFISRSCLPFFCCLLCTSKVFLPLNCFCPSIGVLPKPPTSLSATQLSPLPYVGRATFHSHSKEFFFFLALRGIPIRIRVWRSLFLTPMACSSWFQLIFPSFGWQAILAKHFPQKGLSGNPRIDFPHSFPYPPSPPDHTLSYLWPMAHHSCIG